MNAPDNNKIGYGQPPVHTRFKKGQSGNCKGRPRKNASRSTAQMIDDALQTRISMTINGKKERVTTAQVITRRLAHEAASGDLAAINTMKRMKKYALARGEFPGINIVIVDDDHGEKG